MSVPTRPLVLSLVALLSLAGCTSAGAVTEPSESVDPAGPLSVTNCGTAVTFDEAPERVVTIKSTIDRDAVGSRARRPHRRHRFPGRPGARPMGAMLPPASPSLADKVPSEEVVLETQPDLVYAGWESNFSAEGVGERAELASLGVASYVSPSACQSVGPAAPAHVRRRVL